jgi:hypothetical protein
MYEEVELELEEARDLGEGVAFAVSVQRGRLPSSTSWVEFRYASVTTRRDGLAERVTDYTDVDEARAAAERLAEERRARDRRRRRRAASSRVTAWLRAQRLPALDSVVLPAATHIATTTRPRPRSSPCRDVGTAGPPPRGAQA